MINITISHSKDGELLSCTARGHADYAQSGSDIVCSATSILMRTLALDLDEKARASKGLVVAIGCVTKGELDISIKEYPPQFSPYLSFLLGFLKKGFESLSFEFPEHVNLEILSVN